MTGFTFVHAADLHLDSPLLGLAGKSTEYAARVEAASRQTFDNLIALAVDDGCRFIVLAGDIFDGELRNFQTGLYFMDGMRRLDEAGIDVFMVLGNHDSANRFADKLSLTGNVHVFPKAKPATHLLDDVRVAIHGRSFPRPDVSEDIAREYHSSSASPNQATETRRCASSSQGGGATALTLGITRQTPYRHVTPSGELRLDGQKLMARGLTLFI